MLRYTLGVWCVKPARVRWHPLGASHFDVCVIGAGPAGIAATLRAVDYKKRVCLIEASRVGGCDLWNGALQSKVMWEMSNFLVKANGSAAMRVYNTTISNFMELDEERMRECLIRSSEMREAQILAALRAADVSLMYGRAFFASSHKVEVRNRETKEYRTVTADYFIIATGSTPMKHPFVQIDQKRVVTSDELMMMPLPRSMVVVGAGVLGSEFAAIYARLGRTKVYLLDKAERIMPKEDDDVVAEIQGSMEAHGVVIHQDAMLYNMQSWEEDDAEMREHPEDPTRRSGVRYTIMQRKTRELQTYEVERALIAVGRHPNYYGLGLQNTQCTLRNGTLVLDAYGRCMGQSHIYAVGDAADDSKLVSVGEAKGRLAVDHMFSLQLVEPPSTSFTRLVFLTVALAGVGMNEQECRKQRVSYVMAKYGFDLCSRTIAADCTAGFVKILATNDSRKTLLGVRVVGMNASTIIELASAAIRRKQTAYELCELLTAYPSVSQAFLECLRVILGCSTLKPGTFPNLVCETWTPSDYVRGRAHVEHAPPAAVAAAAAAAHEEGDAQATTQTYREHFPHTLTEGRHEAKADTSASLSHPSSSSSSSSVASSPSSSGRTASASSCKDPLPGAFFFH